MSIWMDVDSAITIPVNKVPLVALSDGYTIDETIAYNEGGMDLNWNFFTTAGVMTQTNVVPTTAGDYDWTHVGNGMYKIEMTASGGASANNDVEGFGWFSGKADAILPFSGPIIGFRAAALNNALIDGGDLIDVNVTHIADTAQTGRDIGANVLLSPGSGAGQLDFTSGVVKSNLAQILGTALTETAGYIAAGFKKLFNVVTPVLTMESVNQSANNNTILAHGIYGSSALQVLVAALQTDLDNGTDGLGALKILIDAVPTVDEIQAGIEENGASVIDTIRDYIENVTYGLSALKTLIDAVNTDLSNGTDGLGALKTLIDTVNTDLSNGTDGLGALKALIDVNKSELDGLQGTDGKCLISTDVQNLIASLIVDAEDSVCDAPLTGTSHNIVTSLGRRVREIGAFAIESGTAQGGTLTSITLAATANGSDGVFNRNLIVLTGNTGKGQTRTIVDYNSITKVVVIDRDWRVIPDDTTEYQVTPDDTPLTVDHGIVQGATATTITIRDYASSVNNAYLCNIVAIMAGKGRGQTKLVGSYNGTTKVITICGDDWVEIPDTTSVYVMMPYGTTCVACLSSSALELINTELDNVLNTAIPGSVTADSINQRVKAIDDLIQASGSGDLAAMKTKTDNLPSGVAKNVALPNPDIFMLLEDGITAATGKTVTGQIRKDAGSFTGLTNAITEVSGGLYTMADGITQAEMNADKVTLKFTADGCRDTIMIIYPT